MTQQSTPIPRATDPRPARTREAIYAAVRELSAESALDDSPVTVSVIVSAAGISRGSFYAQFADLDELMIAMIIDAFREIGTADITARHDSAVASNRDLARESLTALARHFADRRRFYLASMAWNPRMTVHAAIVSAFASQVAETLRVLPELPAEVDAADVSIYIGGGLVAVLTAWLREPDPAPVASLVGRLLALLPPWLTAEGPPVQEGRRPGPAPAS